jgi:hypothetical protein
MRVDSSKESQASKDLDVSWLANMLGQTWIIAPRSYQICKRARPDAQHETALPSTRNTCFASDLHMKDSKWFLFLEVCKECLWSFGQSRRAKWWETNVFKFSWRGSSETHRAFPSATVCNTLAPRSEGVSNFFAIKAQRSLN